MSNDLSNVIVGNFIDLVRYMLEPNLNVIDNYPVDDTVIYSKLKWVISVGIYMVAFLIIKRPL